jgi:hypothetical protein
VIPFLKARIRAVFPSTILELENVAGAFWEGAGGENKDTDQLKSHPLPLSFFYLDPCSGTTLQ